MAQGPPAIKWSETFGGTDVDISGRDQKSIMTNDKGFIICGYTYSNDFDFSDNHGTVDGFLIKTDSMGNIQWKHCLGGTNIDRLESVQQTADSGFVAVGYSNSTNGDVLVNQGDVDLWVIKLNKTGAIQWSHTFGGSNADVGTSIQQTTDNGYIVAGSSASSDGNATLNHGTDDYWILKLNPLGVLQWQKSYGGSGNDYGNSVLQLNNGCFIVSGSSNSNDFDVTGAHGGFDMWVIKLDQGGNMYSNRAFGGSYADYNSTVKKVADAFIIGGTVLSDDGDLAYTGFHGYPGYYGDFCVFKVDTAFGPIGAFTRCFGGTGTDELNSLQPTSDGGFILCGNSESYDGDLTSINNFGSTDACLIKLDYTGALEWVENSGGSGDDYGFSIQQTPDTSFIMVGYSSSNDGQVGANLGNTDIWAVKFRNCIQPDAPVVSTTFNTTCIDGVTRLSITSGNLHDATQWVWTSGSCDGQIVGYGTYVDVTTSIPGPAVYYVKGTGGCANGPCTVVYIAVMNYPSPLISIDPTEPCDNVLPQFTVTATNGTPPYIGTGTFTPSFLGDDTTFFYSITDDNGCPAGSNVYLARDSVSPIMIGTVTYTDVTGCPYGNNGTITVSSATGGLPGPGGLVYTISGNDFYQNNTTGLFTGLSGGNYHVNVHDKNYCEADTNIEVTISHPPSFSLAVDPPVLFVCPGTLGSVNLIPSNASGQVNYDGGKAHTTWARCTFFSGIR